MANSTTSPLTPPSNTTGELDLLLPHLSDIRIPTSNDKIYKDECVYSFDSPDSPDGLYVCMKTFLGFGRKFVNLHFNKTGSAVFLNLRRIAVPVPKECNDDKSKITKLALNVEGGFLTNDKQVYYNEINKIVVMPSFREISLSSGDLPEKVVMSVTGILSADSALRQEEIESLQGTWDGEKKIVTKHSDSLLQLDNGVRVPPAGWKCEKCDVREGLWLNLTDGSILCGRKYFDGTGGNNHANEHYEQTKYSLVVKLGTINPNGADVYSYDEDAMVEDPNLDKHLAHFGINISQCQKTEKSIIEMEIDLNKRYDEWAIIQEDGCELKSLFGPGFTGIANLGNSCYLNSVMQMLFSLPDFIREYYRPDKERQFAESNNRDPPGDLRTQLLKFASGILSGEYSLFNQNLKEQIGIKPQMFKNLIGRNHAEFMTKRQQDAQEFFLYVIDQIERLHVNECRLPPPTDCFKFELEERVECGESHKVKYSTRAEFLLSLPITDIPVQNKKEYDEFQENKQEIESKGGKIESKDIIRPVIKLIDCIESFSTSVKVDDFFSSALNRKTFATMTSRFQTFPEYLVIHLKKFTLDQNWVPKKLDISLEVPEVLDLECLRAKGKQPDEEELPEPAESSSVDWNSGGNQQAIGAALAGGQQASAKFNFNIDYLNQLSDMGFPMEACKRALYHTSNESIETATNWLFEHSGDADFTSPFEIPNSGGGGNDADAGLNSVKINVDSQALNNIMAMGFSERHANLALKLSGNNTERAIEWIFSNSHQIDEIEQEIALKEQRESAAAVRNQPRSIRDGSGRYQLVGFISHMGTSTFCGHYVLHLKKTLSKESQNSITGGNGSDQQQWVIFNDNKVAISERPPKQFAYMYLYRRINS